MAYKHTGTVAGGAVGINDPKSILLSAPGAASVATISSADGVEMTLAAPAGGSAYVVRSGALADRFPMGKNLTVTVTGDAASFIRIDG